MNSRTVYHISGKKDREISGIGRRILRYTTREVRIHGQHGVFPRLAALGRAPLCRTVLMPQEAAGAWLRARQVVGCGLSPRCSLTLSGLSPRPVLCVQRRLTAVNGAAIEPQDIPLPLRWGRLPPEALLLAAGAWLLAEGRLPD